MEFLTKAQTLYHLLPKVRKSRVLPLLILSQNEKIDLVVKKIQKKFNNKVIIRSSSYLEDTSISSNAGKFESILNVDVSKEEEIKKAFEQVTNSYSSNNNEILVQPMLENVKISGVALSADLDVLSKYYIINYDESGITTCVTDGVGKNLKTYIEFKGSNVKRKEPFLDLLIEAIKELESLFQYEFLDIEFAYDGTDIYIFQVRKIVSNNKEDLSGYDLSRFLFKLNKKIKKLNTPHPNLLGDYTMFGVMPDWNPAEIIGKKPKPLSLSLYKELITDSVWAYQRDNYGYRNLRSHPLLVSLLGVAYIDVRVSFNSFIPKELDEKVANKLVNYYLKELKKSPHNHDKIEFEVIFSCYDFSTQNKIKNLLMNGFKKEEVNKLEKSLRDLTNNIFKIYKKDLEKIYTLEDKYSTIISSDLSLVDKIYWLNENCKRYGTLPFAGLARAAFVAISFLKSFISQNIIKEEEYSAFLKSINSIAKKLSIDESKLDKEEFLKIYGHLRPGTYDILSERYDKKYDEYFDSSSFDYCHEEFHFTQEQLSKIDLLLNINQLDIKSLDLINFIKVSIESREYAKFIFTKSLSQILVYIEELGKRFNIGKEDLSYLDYQQVLKLYATLTCEDVNTLFKLNIEQNKKLFNVTKALKLPDLIINEDDIYSFYLLKNTPNFITMNFCEAKIIHEDNIHKENLDNKIVCIRSADPGYDFLFTKNIGGLITCYGGVNSHMAIRCAELNLPAVIGLGELEYENLLKATFVRIDAKSQILKVIK